MEIIHETEHSIVGWSSWLVSWIHRPSRPRRLKSVSSRASLSARFCTYLYIFSRLHVILCLFFVWSANYGPTHNNREASRLFPPVKPHSPNTILRPSRQSLSTWDRQKQWIWSLYQRLREPDSRYAIKTGTGTAILALPAFIDSTRPWFLEYRGEWALISFFVGKCLFPCLHPGESLIARQLICKSCRKRLAL